ncbi:MAG: acyl--CoA ligase [Acidobacteria bacterium]|nr:acyl--CoA ligase [Acidobacteriota bacterium]
MTTPAGMGWFEAIAAATGPGQIFELIETDVRGVRTQVFKNAPANVAQFFALARNHGDKDFLVYEDERLTFTQSLDRIDALGHALVERYGVQKGDRVAVAMRNYPEWCMSFAAILSVGGISVSMNSWWKEEEMDYALRDSSPKVLICDDERYAVAKATCEALGIRVLLVRSKQQSAAGADHWHDVVQLGNKPAPVAIGPDDDATILYTSGTTGFPKGAVSTHRAIVSALMSFSLRQTVDGMRATSKPEPDPFPPSFILIVPLFHVTGCVPVMMSCFVAGLKLVIMYKWDPEKAMQLIEREKVTNFVGVPTQSWDLVNHPAFPNYDLSSLRAVGGGGAPAPAALVHKVANSFKKGGPQLGYGMTETNAFGPGNRGADYVERPTSTGRAVLPMKVEIRDAERRSLPAGQTGDIWMSGPMLIRGYWNKPEATAATIVDGWLLSGDIGRMDDDGFLYIEDRAKDMILRAGENVYGAEVEHAIYEHPAVHEAAVFGLPHERLGEEVAVAVYPKVGHQITAAELWAFLDGKIASFKVPSHVAMLSEPLPRNAAGKFLKRELRDRVVNGGLSTVSR